MPNPFPSSQPQVASSTFERLGARDLLDAFAGARVALIRGNEKTLGRRGRSIGDSRLPSKVLYGLSSLDGLALRYE